MPKYLWQCLNGHYDCSFIHTGRNIFSVVKTDQKILTRRRKYDKRQKGINCDRKYEKRFNNRTKI